jgi:hypothetical protein
MTRLTQSEQLLQKLGITDPSEIDLEAIAFYVGALVRFRPLDGCEARIVGHGDHAIISVNKNSSQPRKRFSIAHELGHWQNHRGKTLVCRAEDYKPREATSPERIADIYAADLLMPNYLFKPIVQQYQKLNFKTVQAVADVFQTSITATAIRLVEHDHSAAVLICHGQSGRKWFTRAPSVPSKWFPRDELDADSFAFDILYGSKTDDPMPRRMEAGAWFDRQEARRFEVFEQSLRIGTDVLTLVLINDPAMLSEESNNYQYKRA